MYLDQLLWIYHVLFYDISYKEKQGKRSNSSTKPEYVQSWAIHIHRKWSFGIRISQGYTCEGRMAKVPPKEFLLWLFFFYELLVLYSFLNVNRRIREKGSQGKVKMSFRVSKLIGTDYPLCFWTTVHFNLYNIILIDGNMESLLLF